MLRLRIDEPKRLPRWVDVIAPPGGGFASLHSLVQLATLEDSVFWVYAGPAEDVADETTLGPYSVGDTFSWRTFTVTIEPPPVLDEDTLARLAVLMRGDGAAREVFIDELEAAGRSDEAAYLRALITWSKRGSIANREALEARAAHVDPQFRAQVADVSIERCETQGCPKRWNRLELCPVARERHCATCERIVTFCDGPAEARIFEYGGAPVAIEPSRRRSYGDLETRFVIG